MAIDRVNALFVGRVKDAQGFTGDPLEDPLTGAQMIAYSPETWWERCNHLQRQEARGKRDNTPRNAWPARLPRKE